ncbi:MAG TPA: MBL fold metallo-hydrolase [Desulfotomaculum sp.]|nr:MBL fold metallo-hydrolase [Desulfotomaculum sp.]
MRLRFLGAARTVTGSCHLLEVGATRLMVDCGMFQGPRALRENNYRPFMVAPGSVDYVLLTHAHIDHSGLIPKLVKQGFKGRVLTTRATADLCSVMLPDSGHIQEMEVERLNRKAARSGRPPVAPVYTMEDAHRALEYFHPVDYGETVDLNPGISVRFLEAGHILGSALVEVTVREGGQTYKLVFTGDLGERKRPFLKDPAYIDQTDYLIMESTYGDRLHPNGPDHLEILHEVIWDTYRRGGNLIIPAFAVERTQDLIYDLNLLVNSGRFPPMKIYIDSPMAAAATAIFKKHAGIFDEEARNLMAKGQDPLTMAGLTFARTVEESMALNKIKGGAIIIAASGMCEAGRIKHHLKHNLWRPECTVLFVGYQAPGTKGRKIKDGAKFVRIHGEEVFVRAAVRSIDSYSAHADQEDLLDWVGHLRRPPIRVFLVHGEPGPIEVLAGEIARRYGFPVYAPVMGEELLLSTALPATEEELRRAHAQVSARLQDLISRGLARGHYQQIMEQLDNLDVLLQDIQQKAG